MNARPLTEHERAMLAPLVQRRALLQRELAALEQGLLTACYVMHGSIDETLSFDPDRWTLTWRDPTDEPTDTTTPEQGDAGS